MIIYFKRLHAECLKVNAVGGGEKEPPVGGALSISAPVGLRGVNSAQDVITIQDALNRVPADQGGAATPLVVDGLCGSKTQKAIQTFQLKHFGWHGADGLVEPSKQTLAKLNELLGSPVGAKGASSSVSTNLIPNMTATLQTVRELILAARTNLTLASLYLETKEKDPGVISAFSRESRMLLLNRHFNIDKLPNKRQTFDFIYKIFQRMDQIFQRPGGIWGAATFEPDQTGDKNLAYAPPHGYFMGGRFFWLKGKKLRADSIYVCASISALVSQSQALTLVHELAHFVGSPELITDHAYNNQGDKLQKLPPHLKVLNAESYMNFAWEAKHLGIKLPPGV